MIYPVASKDLLIYFGILKYDYHDWKKKGIDVQLFYEKLCKCKSYGCQRKLFYTLLSYYYTENKIDTVWARFINNRILMEEIEIEKRFEKKQLKKIIQEKKEGRII